MGYGGGRVNDSSSTKYYRMLVVARPVVISSCHQHRRRLQLFFLALDAVPHGPSAHQAEALSKDATGTHVLLSFKVSEVQGRGEYQNVCH